MRQVETCRCGGGCTVEADDWPTIEHAIRNWRTIHDGCTTRPGKTDPHPTGSTCGVVGFAADERRGDVTA